MITRPNFTWLLESDDLAVRALKFPVCELRNPRGHTVSNDRAAHGVHFRKVTTLPGALSHVARPVSDPCRDQQLQRQRQARRLPGMFCLSSTSDSHLAVQLPGDDPAGGITFSATTELNNPSPFDVALGALNCMVTDGDGSHPISGTALFDLTYKGVALGTGTSHNTQLVRPSRQRYVRRQS